MILSIKASCWADALFYLRNAKIKARNELGKCFISVF